ncbi:Orf110b protein [Striga asiatica]|uniref:Orf110b protein n=1 Tax=Striga asiatica TaxID=4170 RepID=A0A5A7Q1I4_STRAF|nr:Orf110b protein [Striga asiatica]
MLDPTYSCHSQLHRFEEELPFLSTLETNVLPKRFLLAAKREVKVTGFEPMALCTQNRCADQTALHLVSPSEAYRSARSMKTRTELAHPFGHRGARTNPSNQPLFLSNLPPALLYGFLPFSFTFISKSGSLSATFFQNLRPLRSGFEPLTQGFSVLCSNQLSYLNHFPK